MSDTPLIRSIRPRAVNAPISRPVRTASGALESAPLLLIDVETDQGVTGRAYIMGYTVATLEPMRAFLANIEAMAAGQPVAPADRAAAFEAAFRLLGRQGLVGMALSGLDMALWDALGQARGVPVVELLGGTARPIDAYDSYGIVDPTADAAALERSIDQGFRGIKIKLGDGDLDRDVDTVAGVREIIGEDIALMVDYNQSLSAPEAVRRIDRLGEFDLHWLEEPVPAEDWSAHSDVRAASPVPVQTGENWWFTADMSKAIAEGACDFAMPDLMKIGGITGWLSAMGVAHAAGIPVSSHLFVEASAHVLPVTPTAHWLEYLDVASAVLAEPLEIDDGSITARGPGLGMEWDEDAVERFGL